MVGQIVPQEKNRTEKILRDCKKGVKDIKEYTEKKKEYREWVKKKKRE